MEFTLWTALWSEFKDEFDNERNLFGGSLGNKAAEDLRQKIIEHVVKHSNEILNSWSMNLEKLLDVVEQRCPQLQKETMVHKVALKL